MKNRLKSIILLGIVFVLVFAACSGNGGSKNSETSNNTNNNASNNTNSNETDNASGEEEVVRRDITVSIYDRGNVPSGEGTVEDNRWTRWLNENGPANLKFLSVPRWESKEKFNTMFAAGNAPDLIFEFDTNYRNELINQKQLMPLNDLIEQHSVDYKQLVEQFPALKMATTRSDGNMYEFGRVKSLRPNHTFWIRADWLDNLGLKVPETVEDLYTVAEAFTKQDPDQNGENDTYGIGLAFTSKAIFNNMFQNVEWFVQDGELKRTWDQMEAVTRFQKRLYDAGFAHPDFLVDKNGEAQHQLFITGKLGILGVNGGAVQGGLNLFTSFKENNPDGKVMAIPLPASEFGQFSPVIDNPVQMTASVNANAEHPEAVMAYVDFLVRESTQQTLQYGLEGEHYENNESGCPQVIDPEKNKQELNWIVDFRMLISEALLGDCAKFANQLDPNNPIDMEFKTIIEQAEDAYLSKERMMANITHVEHMPAAPAEVQLTVTNTRQEIEDMLLKAVVSGENYTVEKAMEDVRNLWYSAGGQQVEDWYANWYAENKDTAFLTKDIYDLR